MGGLNTIFYKFKRFKNIHFKTIKQKTPSIKNTGGLNDPPVRFYIEESVDCFTILTAAGSSLKTSSNSQIFSQVI